MDYAPIIKARAVARKRARVAIWAVGGGMAVLLLLGQHQTTPVAPQQALAVTAEAEYQFADPCGLTSVECGGEDTSQGLASWYAKGLKEPMALTAASTTFKRGTRLEVTAPYISGQIIYVTVNDYGPDPKVHPDRILDLSLGAFEALGADPAQGVIYVEVKEVK